MIFFMFDVIVSQKLKIARFGWKSDLMVLKLAFS